MNERALRAALRDLPLGGIRFYETTASTNDTALAWAAAGGPNRGLVYAEEQTAGRGRSGRKWYTPPAAALAFSLILRPLIGELQSLSLFSALGALAVSEALGALGLHPEIKWPNDVLLGRKKVCGVLAEAVWLGEELVSVVLGIGINVSTGAVPPMEELNFPATSLEAESGLTINRLSLLRETIIALLYWRGLLTNDLFLQMWEDHLAFRGEQVEVWMEGKACGAGRVEGLESNGSLRLRSSDGQIFTVQFGEVHLRPVV